MNNPSITRADIVKLLNEALECDRDAISKLVLSRMPCNKALTDHPTIQVNGEIGDGGPENCEIGVLGLINGLFQQEDVIALVVDDDKVDTGPIIRFQ